MTIGRNIGFAISLGSLGLVACGGASTTSGGGVVDAEAVESAAVIGSDQVTDAAPSLVASTEEWASRIERGHVHPVFEVDGRRWLHLEDARFFEHELLPSEGVPESWFEADSVGATLPAPDADGYAAAVLVGPEGPCTAALSPPVFVNRSGCAPDAGLAQEIVGCEGPVAPLAWTDLAPDDDAAWAAVDFVPSWPWLDNEAEVPTLRSTAPFSLLAAYESELFTTLIEVGVEASNFESAAMMGWAAAGDETVSALYAAAHTLDTAECEDWSETFVTVGFEVEEGWRTVVDDFPISGVIADGPDIVALIGADRRASQVLVRREKYVFEPAIDDRFWFENAECEDAWTPVSFEQDCAP